MRRGQADEPAGGQGAREALVRADAVRGAVLPVLLAGGEARERDAGARVDHLRLHRLLAQVSFAGVLIIFVVS